MSPIYADEQVAAACAAIERLRGAGAMADRAPHPRAANLRLPDGTPAPAVLRVWAGFDAMYPWSGTPRRGLQPVADDRGMLAAGPMAAVVRWTCLNSVADRLGDEPRAGDRALDLAEVHARQFDGYGVVLEPWSAPDRVLWLPRGGPPTVMRYAHGGFDAREPFGGWLARVCGDR